MNNYVSCMVHDFFFCVVEREYHDTMDTGRRKSKIFMYSPFQEEQ